MNILGPLMMIAGATIFFLALAGQFGPSRCHR